MRESCLLGVIGLVALGSSAWAQGGAPPPAPQAPRGAEVSPAPLVALPVAEPVRKTTPVATTTQRVTPAPARLMNRVTLSPLSLLGVALSVEYERVVNEGLSVFVGPSFFGSGFITQPLMGFSFFGGSVDAGLRIFPAGAAPSGFWVGPQARVLMAAISDPIINATGYIGSLVATAGYTSVSRNGLTLSAGGGLGLGYGLQVDPTTGVMSGPELGPMAALHFNLGWAF